MTSDRQPDEAPYRLGLPAWAFPGWSPAWFDAGEPRLTQYARVFSCVEGNTTFYHVPTADTVRSWRDQVAGQDFRFCFKLPRSITHEPGSRLPELTRFIERLAPLGDHLGPFHLQFPATVGPEDRDHVMRIIGAMPRDSEVAVELRHPALFKRKHGVLEFLDGAADYAVTMDARPIHRAEPDHPEIVAAQHKKPNLPVYNVATDTGAFVRLVLHPDAAHNGPWLGAWTRQVATWLEEGRSIYMMIHCSNNQHCPSFARAYHEQLRALSPALRAMPDWPTRQTSLF